MAKKAPSNESLYKDGYGFVAFRSKERRDEYVDYLRSKGHDVETGRSTGPVVEGGRANAYYVNTSKPLRKKKTKSHDPYGNPFESFRNPFEEIKW